MKFFVRVETVFNIFQNKGSLIVPTYNYE